VKLENEKEELEVSEKEAKEKFLIIKGENNELQKRLATLESNNIDLLQKYIDFSEKYVMLFDENKKFNEHLEALMINIEDILKQIVTQKSNKIKVNNVNRSLSQPTNIDND
jgi:hypothetical protein